MAGEILKKKREDLGIELDEAAESLKIGQEYLAAIENDAFDKLPVPVYTMGYIRSYAAFVGIDADAIVQFYREHLPQPQPSTIVPISFSRKKGLRPGYLFAVLGAVIIAFILYPYARKQQNAESISGSRLTQEAPAGAGSGTKAARTVEAPQEEAGERAERAGDGGLPQEPVAAAGQHNLSITADATTWISVSLENGRIEEVLLRPGQSKKWSFSGKVFLKVGNAGGISINLDGTDLGKPGGPGQVMNIRLPKAEEGNNHLPLNPGHPS